MEMLHFGFMQRAFWAGGLIAIIAPILGMFLILRRQSLMADTLSHVSLAGVALGLTLHSNINVTTIIIIIMGAIGLEYMRVTYRAYSEVSVAVLMAAGLSLALVLMSLSQGKISTNVEQYLFGSIVTISKEQLSFLLCISITVIICYIVFHRPMYVLTFDEDTAFTSGLPTKWISLIFSILTGLTISVMMPIVGALLVSALMVLPAAISMRLTKGFQAAIVLSIVIGFVSMLSGLTFSYEWGTPPGATITLLLVVLMIGSFIITAFKTLTRSVQIRKQS